MLRGFRHTLFVLLQLGVLVSGAVAVSLWPQTWPAVLTCVAGSIVASIICERIARRYLRRTLGELRRAADEISRGTRTTIDVQPGADLYKLVAAINHVAARLAEASAEEKRLAEELRRRERLAFLGELAASVAHEINNPLDGVQNCARLLRRYRDDPVRSEQMLDLIDSGLARIDTIVRRLLALARESDLRPTLVRARQVVESAVAAALPKIESRGVRVRVEPLTEQDTIRADRLLLEQAIINLLLNAADSMPDGGETTVRIMRESYVAGLGDQSHVEHAAVVIEVADRGCGIPPELLPRIFEPFVTTKPRSRGTGLGLAIVARIVDAHRGRIDVRARDGGGTLFRLMLPAAPESRAAAQVAWVTAHPQPQPEGAAAATEPA